MTEEEAKKKWCPFVRQSATFDGYGLSYNRSANSPSLAAPCIGSACMAWRSVEDEWSRRAADVEYAHSGRRLAVTSTGYCGLAGRP